MSSKKIDILGALLHGREQPPAEAAKAIEKMIRGKKGEAAGHDQAEWRADLRLTKIKTTYYLGEAVYDHLEDARRTIIDMLPEKDRPRVTRSLLVELAVRIVLQDFKKQGQKSAIYQWLFRGLDRAEKR